MGEGQVPEAEGVPKIQTDEEYTSKNSEVDYLDNFPPTW